MSSVTVPPVLTSPRDDAIQLYRAFKGILFFPPFFFYFLLGLGCDTAAVVHILAHRDVTQRGLIQQEYRAMYSEDLVKRLSSELSGDVKRAVLLWVQDPAGRDASIVRQALSGNVVDLKAATEVICSRTPSQIQHFKQLYFAMFGVYLEQDIEYQASGDHKKVLSLTFHDFDISLLPSIVN
ncbi:Annexin D5 [Vitis vinifera]|uniref:Annexin D5 n=1 Tax=Vitis vinifera TaxID=29760 RepID=A0A438HXL5_VITVI|nr:Annexin D5 [Vitis vinifera]